MKHIAIFCDGTWNAPGKAKQTHVVRLAEAVRPVNSRGEAQQVIYQHGVGSGKGGNRAARFWDRILGGAFGQGLDENIASAYLNLILNYEPGDKLHVFGFSRGAYTARSLVGLIRSCGILPRSKLRMVPDAMEQYRSRAKNTHPRDMASIAWRAAHSPMVATSKADIDYRQAHGMGRPALLRVAYLGLWDTVGERGLPSIGGALARAWNSQYLFHDTDLSSMVAKARHAVAIDERRRLYPPTLWGNLAGLNGGQEGRDRPYQQIWFAGDHAAIGGGGDNLELSALTLDWVLEGTAGLDIDHLALARELGQADPMGPLNGHASTDFLGKLMRLWLADRTGVNGQPVACTDIAPATLARAAKDGGYRPATIRHCLDA